MSFIETSDNLKIRLFHCGINILSKSRKKKKFQCSLNTVVVDSDHHVAMFIAEKQLVSTFFSESQGTFNCGVKFLTMPQQTLKIQLTLAYHAYISALIKQPTKERVLSKLHLLLCWNGSLLCCKGSKNKLLSSIQTIAFPIK